MKRYRVRYFHRDRSKLSYFTQLSKLGTLDGIRISFWYDEKKAVKTNSKTIC